MDLSSRVAFSTYVEKKRQRPGFISSQIPSDYKHYRLADLISQWLDTYDEKLRKLEHYIEPVKELSQVANMGGMIL